MLSKKQLGDAVKCKTGYCGNCNMEHEQRSYADSIEACFEAATTCVEQTAQTALACLAMLERLEWGDTHATGNYCPICENKTFHKPDCELSALLKEMEVGG